ncbi:GDSL lipase/acylhydrolase [Mycena sp. CBHHK59/15]|nr:GDSL lipase/acylhydrolase [Mycena sp. CBHHK59/15]
MRLVHQAQLALASSSIVSAVIGASRGGQIENLVTFGDSYTDVRMTGDAGVSWPDYAAGSANVSLYPFARWGATCSNNITFSPWPSLFESQLPLYFAEKANGTLKLDPHKTLYTLWIGTNDIGRNSLLTGTPGPQVSLVDTTACAVNWVNVLYASGARNFLFQNMLPLQHTVLYSANSYVNHYWTMQRNTTEWNVFMTELVKSANALFELRLQTMIPKLPGARIGLFDSYGLFQDIIDHPSLYLNGTAPLNTTGCIKSCVYELNEPIADNGICTIINGTNRDSYIWYDELHPSEQADRVLAKEIAQVIEGKENRWTTWLS